MTRLLASLVLVSALTAASQAQTAADLADDWYTGDGLGFNFDLTLAAPGTFEVTWRGCLGVYGSAEGTWAITEDQVAFTLEEGADDIFKRNLTAADIVSHEGHWLLVPESEREWFKEWGVVRQSCFTTRETRATPFTVSEAGRGAPPGYLTMKGT